MEHAKSVQRVLKDVVTARAAIAAAYMRLWHSGGPSRDGRSMDATRLDTDVNATRDRRSSRDDG